MHLALPTRKSSNPPPYANRSSSRYPVLRRSRVQGLVAGVCGIAALLFILSRLLGGGESIPSGTPPVVIVTVLDSQKNTKGYITGVKENRADYAAKHGYATFLPDSSEYDLKGAPKSWARIPALRHALTKFPHSTYFWFLDQHALIMNPDLRLESHIMNPSKLESLLLKNQPVVPPESVIKTFPNLKGNQIDFVITQDKDGLAPGSLIVRRGEWSKFFLDTWFDPLYRSYNFQKADTHALEHIVQWHPTILSKLAIIPERIMNAHSKQQGNDDKGSYKDGDYVIHFKGCDQTGRSCVTESEPFSKQWRSVFHAAR